jgi:hypothetical protein
VSQNLRTDASESISLLESLQKASEWAQSHVIDSYDKCGLLGDVGAVVKKAARGLKRPLLEILVRVAVAVPITFDNELL